MNERIRKALLSFLVFSVSFLIVVGSVWSVYADATVHIDGGGLKSALDEAAMVQVISNTMKKCINSLAVSGGASQGLFKGENLRKDADNMFTGTTNIPTGVWLENQVQNKVDDGDIWCKNNKGQIAILFAKYVLGSTNKYVNGMICDSNGEKGGMYNAYSKDGATEFGCSTALFYRLKSKDTIRDYLKSLYEEARTKSGNKYWSSWDNLSDYTGTRGRAVGYWMYRKDFATGCESNDKETELSDVSLDYKNGTFGKIEDKTVRVRSNWESKKYHNALGNNMTCKDLQSKMKSYSSDYSDLSVDYLASQCKAQLSPFIKGKLEEYFNILYSDTVIPGGGVEPGTTGYSDGDIAKMQAYYDKWKNYESMDDREFIEETEKGGYQCNTEAGADVSFTPVTPPVDPGEVEVDPCYKNSGALGWILCPVIAAAGGVGQHMWNQIETYHMIMPASEIFKEDGGVKKGWGVVRDIANIAFVILFLVVIFSQLTGVGIDNYGIKKILPKLIVVVVLMNLSYVICQIAVDLSNIFGKGLNNMFSGWAGSIATSGSGASTGGTVLAGGILAGLGTATAVIWGFFSTGSLVVWIGLAVLGIVIIIVAAMLVLYLTLIIREAGIVLLIVLAPVAIVCYILPNTEKLGKKWFEMLKALLLVYPICGAMIGGGQLAGSILSSIDNEGMRLAAAIIQVVPFFFVPMVLRRSLSLMGNVGARLSTLGRSWGRRGSNFVQNGIKGTNRYKDWAQYQQNQTAVRRAQRTKARLDRRSGGNAANLSARQQDRLNKAHEILKTNEAQRQKNTVGSRDDVFRAELAKQQFDIEESMEDTFTKGDATYIEGKRMQNALGRHEDRNNTIEYAINPSYAQGKLAQINLRQENEREGAVLYTRPGFTAAKRSQYEAQRAAEIKKMYAERYANYSKTQNQAELTRALAGSGVDAVEQADAAFDALIAKGDVTELLSAINGANFSTMNAGVKTRLVAKATASGNALLKAWAKQTQGNSSVSSFIGDTGSNGLANYIATQSNEHAFDTADKDTLEFLANNGGGGVLSNETIGSILTSSANASERATAAALKLAGLGSDPAKLAAVGAMINGEGLTKMSVGVAKGLHGHLGNAIAEINKPGNEALKAKVSNPVKTELGIT